MPPSHDQLVFGGIVRKIRQKRELSQEELAVKAGLHRTYVSLLERGRRTPSLTILVRLADGLEITTSELVALFDAERKHASI